MDLHRSLIAGSLVAVALALASCGPEGDPGDADGADGGDTATAPDDAGGSTADVGPDGDVGGGCALFPDGCPEGENCYPPAGSGSDKRRCLTYTEEKSEGDACGGLRECGDGLRCFEGTCRAVCDPSGDPDFGCSDQKVCVGLRVAGREVGWGVCLTHEDDCALFPDDECPEGENCYAFKQGNRCFPYDTDASKGDSCRDSRDCNADQVCVSDGDEEPTCRPKCNEEEAPCESGSCEAISNLSFGACFESEG